MGRGRDVWRAQGVCDDACKHVDIMTSLRESRAMLGLMLRRIIKWC